MIQVRAPDGSIAQFPDGTPDATIQQVMARSYGGPKPPTPAMQRATADAKANLEPPAAQQVIHGMSFGFDPEIAGGIDAARTGVLNAVGRGPGYGMKDAYNASSASIRNQNAQYTAAHPASSFGLQLLGGFGAPGVSQAGKFVSAAKSLPAAIARGALTGGLIGGAYGAGNAGPGRRVQGAATGAAVGTLTGGLTPPSAAVVAGTARKIGGTGAALARGVRNMAVPIDEAAPPTAADTALARANVGQMMRASRVSPADLAAHPAVVAGKPITTAEAMGRTGVSQLGALARRSGSTGDTLGAVLAERAQGTPGRILGDFAKAANISPAHAAGNVDAMVKDLETQAEPLYKSALSDPGPVWNTDLANLAERPVVKKAIAQVGSDMLNAGQSPTTLGIAIDPDTGSFVLNPDLSTSTASYPTATTWDAVKKAIGRQVERSPITGRPLPDSQSSGNYGIRTATRDLTNVLAGDGTPQNPGAIPGYRAALDKAGDYLSLQDAFDRGGKLLTNPNVNEAQFGQVYNDLDEASQHAFRAGFANKMYDMAQNGQLKPQAFRAPRIQDKLNIVLGPQNASDFLTNLGLEGNLAASGQRMAPGVNSPTFELSNAAAEQEGGPNVLGILHALHNPLGAVGKAISAGVSVGTSPQVRSEMGRLLIQDPGASASELQALPPAPTGIFGSQYTPLLSGYAASQAAQ